jgi:hypothetical protein
MITVFFIEIILRKEIISKENMYFYTSVFGDEIQN